MENLLQPDRIIKEREKISSGHAGSPSPNNLHFLSLRVQRRASLGQPLMNELLADHNILLS